MSRRMGEIDSFGGGGSGGGGAGAGWGEDDAAAVFDPEQRRIVGEPIDVLGNPPPRVSPTVWPWLVAAGVLGALWWLTREEKRGPLAGAG